ncbi:hypothetical protein HCN44_003389 [Aphidius gifuensis]|uniref:Protein FRA10AC1 n=1 Tax=Aphidius gifuensis TaxID=684658 RepID=A0A834XZX9_APHGI|nr:protein FRA10AC1 homolog [Aphidius gifuensis]KAF7994299.1 hypothetical protein HCN44_003389 [Aphidius gifuensis]
MFSAYRYLSEYDRHKKLINDYFQIRGGSALQLKRDTSRDKFDYDVIRENHKFLWENDDDVPETWEARLAKKYYDKLFKEYCICDLTHYKYNKVALRWRIEKEVVIGKGQFECANKKCPMKNDLKSWEVNFGYDENGEKKNALVKIRLCPECSSKLNYHSKKREVKRKKSLKPFNTASDMISIPSSSNKNKKTTTIKVEQEGNELKIVNNNGEKKLKEQDATDIWKEKIVESVEKSREDEFEEYLADLFV